MKKEQIINAATEGIIISEIKLEILKIIKGIKSKEQLDINRVINSINAVPIRYFESLSKVSNQTSLYKEQIKNIVSMILRKIG